MRPRSLLRFREPLVLGYSGCFVATNNGLSVSDYDVDVLGSGLDLASPRIAIIVIQDFILLESMFVVVDR